MAKSAEASMNVSALKLADPYVKEILDTAAHVALYNFNSESQEWEKTNIEGALFIYSRTGEPKYNAFVLNRLSTFNLIEPVDEGLDIQLQEPFLLYRNSNGTIHGIWFYDREECARIAKTVEKLVMEVKRSKVEKIDCKSSPLANPLINFVNNEPTNQRVKDFFAKAGSKTPSSLTGTMIGNGSGGGGGVCSVSGGGGCGGGVFRGPRAPPPGIIHRTDLTDANPLLQRLMSTPNSSVQTVQDIEKQHNHIIMRKPKKEDVSRPLSLTVTPQSKIENGLSYLRISESPPKGFTSTPIPSQHYFNPPATSQQSPSSSEQQQQPLEVSVLERSVAGLETPTKPALLTPGMFATTPKEETRIQPEPLTKTQLLQAVSYLLKNDADFVKKLHEAYVKSFVEMVS